MLKYRRLCLSFVFLNGLLGLANAADYALDAGGPSPSFTADTESLPSWLILEIPIVGVVGAAAVSVGVTRALRGLAKSNRGTRARSPNIRP